MNKLNLRQILEIIKTRQSVHVRTGVGQNYDSPKWNIILDSDPCSVLWSFDSRQEAIDFCDLAGFQLSSVQHGI